MWVEETKTGVRIPDAPPLDLAQTLDCGQCFRFEPDGTGGYRGVAGRAAAAIRREGEALLIEGTEERPVTGALFESFWRRYLDLDRDYEAIYRSLVRRMGGKMGRCVRFSPGMRVLRQDPFEALISFILSQNNNVPRIKGIVRRLCRFGEHLGGEDYVFPTPERIVSLSAEELSTLRCGWRDAYIQDAARRVLSISAAWHPFLSKRRGGSCRRFGGSAQRWPTAYCYMDWGGSTPFLSTCG